MMEKSAQAGGGGDARLLQFTLSAITDKYVVYVPAEKKGQIHSPLFLLYPYILYVLCGPHQN